MPSTHNNAGISASSYILVKRNAEICSFDSAVAFLQHSTGNSHFSIGQEVQVGVSTKSLRLRVLAINDYEYPTSVGVVLYDTVILTYRDDETFTVDSGGFHTPTTTTRLSQFAPLPYRHLFGYGNRILYVGGHYGDENANRFTVAYVGIVGKKVSTPILKRKRAKKPHGTIRWVLSDGDILSTNSKHPGYYVYTDIDGSTLDVGKGNVYNTGNDVRGIAKAEVPLNVVNAHREKWGMALIEMTPAGV